ncbi:MAG: adenylate/guanylate cyclase domain-containing protein [Myxococcota bacterium]|nr:adenylate/guanylate cyclase domain-containing protein [Myxococcota bacterium]
MSEQREVELLRNQVEAMLKFPDQNPNPVLKVSESGTLLYANAAADIIKGAWGIEIDSAMPTWLVEHAKTAADIPVEGAVGNRTYAFHVVSVPEFGFINVYGTDITAMKAITKFPNQNPNPVLKIDINGKLLYSNEAGGVICGGWGVIVGEILPKSIVDFARECSGDTLEIDVAQKTFLLNIVPVPEFEFINIYGTDVTAARDNERILGKLSKYFSPQVYSSIFSGDLEVRIQTRRKKLTVFFSDIKGFTELTERLEPEVLTELVTDYLTTMTEIAVRHGGTVDKYIGDAIMVFFGDPESKGIKEDAVACVNMAMEMKSALPGIRKAWQEKGVAHPLDIRIGIHTDICTVGNFGSNDRLDYTTIGNGVNLASRLESNARPNQIMISEDTYLLVREHVECEKLDRIKVKNIQNPIQPYEVRGTHEHIASPLKVDEKGEGFSLFIDPMTIDGIQEKRDLLEEALRLLDRLE